MMDKMRNVTVGVNQQLRYYTTGKTHDKASGTLVVICIHLFTDVWE